MFKGKINTKFVINSLAKLVLSFLSLALFCSYAPYLLGFSYSWITTIGSLLFFPLFLINLIILIILIFLRSKYLIITLISLIPAFYYSTFYFQIRGSEKEDENSLKVMTYNIASLRFGEKENREDKLEKIKNFIATEDPDIICFQEFCYTSSYDIKNELKQFFPQYNSSYYLHRYGYELRGNVILSKLKIIDSGKFNLKNTANVIHYTDFEIKGTKMRIYNCHFQSYSIRPSTVMSKLKDSKSLSLERTKFRGAVAKRVEQVSILLKHRESVDFPAVILGDFNDIPLSDTYKRLSRNTKDSFIEAGQSWGATFNLFFPLFRIDYILLPKEVKVLSHRVLYPKFSDHYPIVSTFNIEKNERNN